MPQSFGLLISLYTVQKPTAMTRKRYQYQINQLLMDLVRRYPQFNFQNHCYRRIAYDNVLGKKWTERYQVFVQECTKVEIEAVIQKLESYRVDQATLLLDNEASLNWRRLARK
ncbi:MAG: hypothetical protein AAGJ18_03660 [Bacteroidota bacterium]